jgi:hypothetical protein
MPLNIPLSQALSPTPDFRKAIDHTAPQFYKIIEQYLRNNFGKHE